MEFVKLNTICNFKQWHTIPTKELKDSGYPVYGANGIIGYSDKYNHEEPIIMICCRGATCGAINVSQGKCYINGNAMAMDNLSKNYDIDYVSYYLKHYDFSSIITGAAQPQITQIGLEKVLIPSLPINVQKQIVKTLKQIDYEIKTKENSLRSYDELIKSRFIELFGDPKTNSLNLDFDKPENLCESISAGGDRPKEVSEIRTNEFCYPIFSNGEKDDGLYGWSKEYRIEKPAVTVSGRGTIGYASYRKEGKFTPIVRLIVMIPNERINPIYLAYYMNLEREEGSGSGVQQLTVPMIKQKNIIVPDIQFQNEFGSFVELIDKSKFVVQQQINDLKQLFGKKMDEYFGG